MSETIGVEMVTMTRSRTYTRGQGSAAWELETPCRITTLEEKHLPKKGKELFGPDKTTNDHSLGKETPQTLEVGRSKF